MSVGAVAGTGGFWRGIGKFLMSPFKFLGWLITLLFSMKWKLSLTVIFAIIILANSIHMAVEQKDVGIVFNEIVVNRMIKGDENLEKDLLEEPLVYPDIEGNLWDKAKNIVGFVWRVITIIAGIWMMTFIWLWLLYGLISFSGNTSEKGRNWAFAVVLFIALIFVTPAVLLLLGKADNYRVPILGIIELLKQTFGILPDLADTVNTITGNNVTNVTNISGV